MSLHERPAPCTNPKATGWCRCWSRDDPAHVTVHPLGDLIDHELDDDGDCVCGPTPERVDMADGGDGWVLVHHSLDNREADE